MVGKMASVATSSSVIRMLEIIGGATKDGADEATRIQVQAGDVVAVVGVTGSGKSCLLNDIECLAQGDTCTMRTVLIDGRIPTDEERFSPSNKLVAQLSQTMSFTLDMEVGEFLELHARARGCESELREELRERVALKANELCGEAFDEKTALCALSGGQSRALMVADLAYISTSPIVLIDELENAGIDARLALDVLTKRGKIVLMATHSPLLMLLGDWRIVMDNGAMVNYIRRSTDEEVVLENLERYESTVDGMRAMLRQGVSLRPSDCGILYRSGRGESNG